MKPVIRFGIDLAKQFLAVCGVDTHEQIVVQKTLKRSGLLTFFANQSAALGAMEAGSGTHHWARQLSRLGHDARVIDPRFVAPYRRQGRTGKHDINDAAAVCEAAGRPRMRFIPVKSESRQAIGVVHRRRTATVAEHTRTINQMRGLLAEFEVVAPRGAAVFKNRWLQIRVDHAEALPPLAWGILDAWYRQRAPRQRVA